MTHPRSCKGKVRHSRTYAFVGPDRTGWNREFGLRWCDKCGWAEFAPLPKAKKGRRR